MDEDEREECEVAQSHHIGGELLCNTNVNVSLDPSHYKRAAFFSWYDPEGWQEATRGSEILKCVGLLLFRVIRKQDKARDGGAFHQIFFAR